MVWFRVDDGFHDHPKVLAAGNAAVGLWTRCGSYASKQLTDGFIPNAIAHGYGTRTVITRLVETGLWKPVDGGYQMHEFLEWNPSADQVRENRAKTAARVEGWRKKNAGNGVTPPECNAVSNAAPVPTRPDPTLTTTSSTQESSSSENTPPPGDDDDGFQRTVELVVDAKVQDRKPKSPKAYRMTTRTNTITEDGELIRRMLNDGDAPEAVALFVLGHSDIPDTATVPWCGPECNTCDGDAWIDTGNGLAPCPERRTA